MKITHLDRFQSTINLLKRQFLKAHFYAELEQKFKNADSDLIPENETLLSIAGGPYPDTKSIRPLVIQLASMCVYHPITICQDAPIRQAVVTRFEKRVDVFLHVIRLYYI